MPGPEGQVVIMPGQTGPPVAIRPSRGPGLISWPVVVVLAPGELRPVEEAAAAAAVVGPLESGVMVAASPEAVVAIPRNKGQPPGIGPVGAALQGLRGRLAALQMMLIRLSGAVVVEAQEGRLRISPQLEKAGTAVIPNGELEVAGAVAAITAAIPSGTAGLEGLGAHIAPAAAALVGRVIVTMEMLGQPMPTVLGMVAAAGQAQMEMLVGMAVSAGRQAEEREAGECPGITPAGREPLAELGP